MTSMFIDVLILVAQTTILVCVGIELFVWRRRRYTSVSTFHLMVGLGATMLALALLMFTADWKMVLPTVAPGLALLQFQMRAREDAPKVSESDEPVFPVVAPDSAEMKLPTPPSRSAQRTPR
jgi:hypothetical protein